MKLKSCLLKELGSWERKHWTAAYKFLPIVHQGPTLGWYPEAIWDEDFRTLTETEKMTGWGTGFSDAKQPISEMLRNAAYIKLVASNLSKAAYSDAITPQIRRNGDSLAPALDYLRGEYPNAFQRLQQRLQKVVPGVRKLSVRRAKVLVPRQRLIQADGKSIVYDDAQEIMGQEVVLDMDTGDRIPAHAISEGTMLALGLLTVLMHPSQPHLVLLDDIEQGLHPKAQRELMNVFQDIIHDNPDLQIIFSTHSPYIVDELMPSQVHVLSVNSSGITQTKRLDEHPDVEWAKQTLTTGEFWDAEGEDWVIAE